MKNQSKNINQRPIQRLTFTKTQILIEDSFKPKYL